MISKPKKKKSNLQQKKKKIKDALTTEVSAIPRVTSAHPVGAGIISKPGVTVGMIVRLYAVFLHRTGGASSHCNRVFVCFNFVATSCPSERLPQKTVLRGIVQECRTKLLIVLPGSLTCFEYSHVTQDLGLKSEGQLVLVRLVSPGVEPTTPSSQIKWCTNGAMGGVL